MRSDALGARQDLLARVRAVAGLLEPPDPRPPLPARRPRDRIDRVGIVRPALVLCVAALVLAAVGTLDLFLALVILVVASTLLVARRAHRGVAWTRARAAHRREYVHHLATLYDRYRVEADEVDGRVRLRLQRYSPGPLAQVGPLRGGAIPARYRVQTCVEATFGPDDEIAALERAVELQDEAEQREATARGIADAGAHEPSAHETAEDRARALAALLREQLGGRGGAGRAA